MDTQKYLDLIKQETGKVWAANDLHKLFTELADKTKKMVEEWNTIE